MKPIVFALLLGVALAPLALGQTSTKPVDVAHVFIQASKYQSGDSMEALRQIEVLIRQAQTDRALRKQLETELVRLLAPAATLEARRFGCTQLAIMGTDRALPSLAELLKSVDSAGFACLALSGYPQGDADKVLRTALEKSRGEAQLQIINTLGDRRDRDSVPALAEVARGTEPAAAEAAIAALAKIGDAPARAALGTLFKGVPSVERAAFEARLLVASQLAESGNSEAIAICEELIATSQPAYVRRSAFESLVKLDPDGGETRILAVLRSRDQTLTPVAIAAVRRIPSKFASQGFGVTLRGLPPEQQVWLINSLAARNDEAARSVLAANLASPHASVRQAAAVALARIGSASFVGNYAKALAATEDKDEARVFESAIADLPGGSATEEAILSEIKQSQGQPRAHLIFSLMGRRNPQVVAALFEETENPDPIAAKAAFRVLSKIVTADNLTLLLSKFARLRSLELLSEVEVFMEQALSNVESQGARSRSVRDVLAQTFITANRAAVMRLLVVCGDAPALNVLKKGIDEPEPQVREAAAGALAEWPDATAWDALAGIYRRPRDERQRTTALGGLVRLIAEENSKPGPKHIERYRQLLEGAHNDNDRKLILSALGSAAQLEALQLALPYLDRRTVRAEAEVAVTKIAEAIKAKHPEAAKDAFARVAEKF